MDSFALGNALMAGAQGTGQLAQGLFKDQVAAANRAQQVALSNAHIQAQQDALNAKNTADQTRADAANKTRIQVASTEAASRKAASDASNAARVSAAKISAAAREAAAATRAAAKANSPTAANKQVQQQVSDAKAAMYGAQKQLDAINKQLAAGSSVDPGYKQLQQQAADQQQLVNTLKAKLSTLGDRNFPAAVPSDFPGSTPIPPPAASTPGNTPSMGAAAPSAAPASPGAKPGAGASNGSAPYANGTVLNGPGGRKFIVQNGVPVPYGG